MSLLNSIIETQTAPQLAFSKAPTIVTTENPTESAVDVIRNTFDFSVDKQPLQGINGQDTPFYGLFRSDNSECVGNAVSDRYVPHTTDDVLALCEAAGNAFGEDMQAKCHFRNGHYVSLAPSDDHRRSIHGMKDNIFPRLIINAGFDGKAFKATVGFYRDLCKNLSMVRSVKETSASIRHTKSLHKRLPELIQVFSELRDSWSSLVERIQAMEATSVNVAAFLEEVYPTPEKTTGRTATMFRNRQRKIVGRMNRERVFARPTEPQISLNAIVNHTEEQRATVWELLNGVQGYVQHDMNRQNNPTAFDRVIMASEDAAVARAESVAVSLLN